MIDQDPAKRYENAAQVAEALSILPKNRRTRWWLVAAVGFVVLTLIGVLLVMNREEYRPADTEMPAHYLQFNRSSDTVILADRIELVDTCTIEARVMLTTTTAKDWSVLNQWQSGREDIYLGVSPDGISGCCHPIANVDARVRVSLNEWHHVAFVCDGVQARLYLDGKMVGGAAATGKIGKGTGVPTIGAIWRPPETPRGSFIGKLHWLRVSNSARYSGSSFESQRAAPEPDSNTLLLFPNERTANSSKVGVGFTGATPPEIQSAPK